MYREVNLTKYVPWEIIGKTPEFRERVYSEELEFENLWESSNSVQDASFIFSTDTKSIMLWENFLRLPHTGTLEERQNRVYVKWNSRVVWTHRTLEKWFNDNLGAGNYDLEIHHNEYYLLIKIFIENGYHDVSRIARDLREIIPANLGIKIGLSFKQKIYYGMYAHKYAHKISQPYRPEDRRENQNIFFGAYQTRRVIKRRAILPDVWTTDSLGYPLEVTGEGERLEYGDK